MSAAGESLVTGIARETIDWMAEDQTREDIADEAWAFALATFVDGTPITPRGYDVSDKFGARYCSWCYSELTDEPTGSTLCRECFFGPVEHGSKSLYSKAKGFIKLVDAGSQGGDS